MELDLVLNQTSFKFFLKMTRLKVLQIQSKGSIKNQKLKGKNKCQRFLLKSRIGQHWFQLVIKGIM